jgi:ribosome biogenesis GTPase A
MSKSNNISVALLGNPNSGKSTLFNSLTGLNQKTGNYPGVTVDKSVGDYTFHHTKYKITDLPGTYSLFPKSMDEEVACKAISNPIVGINESVKINDEIKLAYLSANEAVIFFNQNTNSTKGFIFSIYDINGRLVETKQIAPNLNTFTINTENLSKGVYVFQLNAIQDNSSKTFKYIK